MPIITGVSAYADRAHPMHGERPFAETVRAYRARQSKKSGSQAGHYQPIGKTPQGKGALNARRPARNRGVPAGRGQVEGRSRDRRLQERGQRSHDGA